MKSLLHRPDIIARLRPFRPMYDRIFNRRTKFGPDDAPAAQLRQLRGKGIFLFSFGRSGTTVFCDFIASHPSVVSMGEVLNEDAFHSFFKYLRGRRSAVWPSAISALFYRFLREAASKRSGSRVLFDMKFESLHLVEGNWRLPTTHFKIFDALRGTDNVVILLERRDLVARHLSHQLAAHNDRFHSFQKGTNAEPLQIDIEGMDTEINVICEQVEYVREFFKEHDRFYALSYEELFVRPDDGGPAIFSAAVANRLAELLLVPNSFQLVPTLERMAKEDISKSISNFAAVQEYRAQRAVGAQ